MVNAPARVLVFDSGVGGLSVLDAIKASDAFLELDYAADNAWLPYGLKSDAELRARVPALLSRLRQDWVPDLVVVACNTASTIALEAVRAALEVPVVGVVPPIKPAAALTRTGVIGLLATPATANSAYVDRLVGEFASDKQVVRFGSSALVAAAEAKMRGAPETEITEAVGEAIGGLFGAEGGERIDVVALACTHFPLLGAELAAAAPRLCVWLDSGAAIARRVAVLSAAPEGSSRASCAGFTDAAALPYSALRARGFGALVSIGSAPDFSVFDV